MTQIGDAVRSSHALRHVDAQKSHAVGNRGVHRGAQRKPKVADVAVGFFGNWVILIEAREGFDQVVAMVGNE